MLKAEYEARMRAYLAHPEDEVLARVAIGLAYNFRDGDPVLNEAVKARRFQPTRTLPERLTRRDAPLKYDEAKAIIDARIAEGLSRDELCHLARVLRMDAYYTQVMHRRAVEEKCERARYEALLEQYKEALDRDAPESTLVTLSLICKAKLPAFYGKSRNPEHVSVNTGKTSMQRAVERSEREYAKRSRIAIRAAIAAENKRAKEEREKARQASKDKLAAVIKEIHDDRM